MNTIYKTKSKEETQKIAREIGLNLKESKSGATVIGLYGDLGAGKTTFSQGLALFFGVSENIVSPTFVIEKIYELPLEGRPFFHLIHIDAYRIEKSTELISLGWNEIIKNPSNIILVEWPEIISDIMPEHTKIFFRHVSENEREVEIEQK